MKLYTPPEMSKKLVALGCTSQSGMFWVNNFRTPDEFKLVYDDNYDHIYWNWLDLPAFEFEDFAGPGEHSKKNCELLIQPKNNMYNLSDRALTLWNDEGYSPQKSFRLALTDSLNWVEEVGRWL